MRSTRWAARAMVLIMALAAPATLFAAPPASGPCDHKACDYKTLAKEQAAKGFKVSSGVNQASKVLNIIKEGDLINATAPTVSDCTAMHHCHAPTLSSGLGGIGGFSPNVTTQPKWAQARS